MNYIRNSFVLALKDLKILFKDRGHLAVLFLLPLLLGLMQGLPFVAMREPVKATGETKISIKAYIVNLDQGTLGAQVVSVLQDIKPLNTFTLANERLADKKVADGDASAAIIIPEDFTERINSNQPIKLKLIKDPTQQAEAQAVIGILNDVLTELSVRAEIEYGIRAVYARAGILESGKPELIQAAQAQTLGAIWTAVQEIRQNPAISVRLENLAEEELLISTCGYAFAYYMPMFATLFAFFMIGQMSESILNEKTAGSFRRLRAAPMPPSTIITGKMLAFIGVVFMQMLLLLGISHLFFDMPLGQSPEGLIILTLALALAATCLGMLIGAFVRTSKQAANLGVVIGFLLFLASGIMSSTFRISETGGSVTYPSEGFSYYLSQLTPHIHAVDGYNQIMVDGAGLMDIGPNILILLGFASVFFLVAIWRFRFD
jgi:ABC-2 type transport system permease protein